MVPVNVVVLVVQTVGFSGCKEEEDYYISWLSSERRDNLELVKERASFSGWKVGWLVGWSCLLVRFGSSSTQCREGANKNG